MADQSTPETIRVYGASDDLIETRGAVDEEFGAVYGGTTNIVVLAHRDAEEVEVRLTAEYDPDDTGEWRLKETTSTGLVTITPARGEDEPDDEDRCPGYSDKVIVAGGFAVEIEGGTDA
jgi:hypothetical protein